MPKYVTPLIIATIFLFGCTIDDEDRCPDGLVWDSKILACREIPDGGELDAGVSDASTTDGYLTECMGDEDCASYEADYCMKDPTSDDPGYCLLQDCTADSCPSESVCCDCTTLMMPIVCIPEAIIPGTALTTCDCDL